MTPAEDLTPADVSVVIPAINEAESIAAAIDSARQAGAVEIIVSDGGSQDATIDVATEAGATKVIRSLPGRGIQLNSGALFAKKTFVLFLHADNTLSADCLNQICRQPAAVWGAYRQSIEATGVKFRLLEWGNAARVRLRRVPFGDQAIFVRRDVFKAEGGYAEIPLMEDVELSRRLRRIERPQLLPGPVTISARRWQKHGVVRQTLRNWSIQFAYATGTSPETLKRRYQ